MFPIQFNFNPETSLMTAVSSRMGGVKNRAAAPIQITAEQLLREAGERKIDGDVSYNAVAIDYAVYYIYIFFELWIKTKCRPIICGFVCCLLPLFFFLSYY